MIKIFFALSLISCFILSFFIADYIKDKKFDVSNILDKDESEKELKKIKAYYKYKEKKTSKIIKYINSLILKSNIHSRMIKPITVILVSILIAVMTYIPLSSHLTKMQSLILSAFMAYIPTFILYSISEYVGRKTDKSFIDFLNLLENFLDIKDDINYAIKNISEYSDIGILSEFCEDYIFETEHGITSIEALNNLSEKVSNMQFKYLIKMFINCNKNSGKYLMIVKRFKDNYLELYDKMLNRKAEAKKNRIAIMAMLIAITIGLIFLIMSNGNIKYLLTKTKIGEYIATFSIISFIVTFFIAINVGKFNFD